MNTPVQGTSADIIKVAMVKLHRKMRVEDWGKNLKMLLQVHDDLLFELPKSELLSAAPHVKKEMEGALSLSVPILIDLKWGENWAEMKELKI